mgnify:FL=1
MKIIDVELKGISPLMQHRYTLKTEKEDQSKKKSGVVDYSEAWINALYWNDEIGIYQPASHIEGAMIKAATNFQIPGRRGKTYKDIFKSSVFVRPDYIPFRIKGEPKKLLERGKFDIDIRPVVIQRSRVERARPIFRNWNLKLQIEIHDEQIPEEVVKEVLDFAGKFCGIGDFRPRHGRFQVIHFGVN